MLSFATVQPSASATATDMRAASAFRTGSAPGSPRHTGHVCVLGGSPKLVAQAQNAFVRVRSCACTSSPMTASQPAGSTMVGS